MPIKEEVARWARIRAAKENMSVSRLVASSKKNFDNSGKKSVQNEKYKLKNAKLTLQFAFCNFHFTLPTRSG